MKNIIQILLTFIPFSSAMFWKQPYFNGFFKWDGNNSDRVSLTTLFDLTKFEHPVIPIEEIEYILNNPHLHAITAYYYGQNLEISKRQHRALEWRSKFTDIRLEKHDHINYRYEIVRLIGSGGHGVVYEVLDHKTTPPIRRALKVICCNKEKIMEYVYTDELQSLKAITKYQDESNKEALHLTSLIDFGSIFNVAGNYFLVLPFHGLKHVGILSSSQTRINSLNEIREYLRQSLEALVALNHVGIVHNDIKPPNLMVDNGQIYLIDFGCSFKLREAIPGQVSGTAEYQAPEEYMGWASTAGHAKDIWSLGVVFSEVLLKTNSLLTIKEKYAYSDVLLEQIRVFGLPSEKVKYRARIGQPFTKAMERAKNLPEESKGLLNYWFQAKRSWYSGQEREYDDLVDLLKLMLDWDSDYRISAQSALQHKFFTPSNNINN